MSRSSVVAIGLAGLAVVLAATGTAVAVTTTHVNIADPVTPSQIARVDSSGRLATISARATYSFSSLLANIPGDNFVTSPTTASLAVTSISLSHPSVTASSPNTELRVFLYKVTSSSTTTCTPTAYQQLFAWDLAPGEDINPDLSVPLVTKPTGGKPYCLSLYEYAITGTYGAGYYPFGTVNWYVAGGTYSGPGAAAKPLTPAQVRRQAGQRTDR